MSDPMPMSEARRYQQRRGHLSYLKLNDAAEALPRVLDQARAERMTLTTGWRNCWRSKSRRQKPANSSPGCASPACQNHGR